MVWVLRRLVTVACVVLCQDLLCCGLDANSAGSVCVATWQPAGNSSSNASYRCCSGWRQTGNACTFSLQRQCTLCFPCIVGELCGCGGETLAPLCQAATLMCGRHNSINFNDGFFPTLNTPLDLTDWLLASRMALDSYVSIAGKPNTKQNSAASGDRVALFDSQSTADIGAKLLTVLYMQPPQDCVISFDLLLADAEQDNNTDRIALPRFYGDIRVRVVSFNSNTLVFSRTSAESLHGWTTVEIPVNVSSSFQLEFEARRGTSTIIAIDNIRFSEECCASTDDFSGAPPPDQEVSSAMPTQLYPSDLEIDATMLKESIYLDNRLLTEEQISCSISENCLRSRNDTNLTADGREERSLLRFTTAIWNNGPGEFRAPQQDIPFFHQCHNHYHSFAQFVNYQLIDETGQSRGHGHKASFCLLDSMCRPGIQRKHKICTATFQAISVGCADVYESNLDCQWVDMTGLPAGCYQLTVHVNPDNVVPETSLANNRASTVFYFSRSSLSLNHSRCNIVFRSVDVSTSTESMLTLPSVNTTVVDRTVIGKTPTSMHTSPGLPIATNAPMLRPGQSGGAASVLARIETYPLTLLHVAWCFCHYQW